LVLRPDVAEVARLAIEHAGARWVLLLVQFLLAELEEHVGALAVGEIGVGVAHAMALVFDVVDHALHGADRFGELDAERMILGEAVERLLGLAELARGAAEVEAPSRRQPFADEEIRLPLERDAAFLPGTARA